MAGFVIHLAIGKEFIRKHPNIIKNEEEFLKGVVVPDLMGSNKMISHYSKYSRTTNLKAFLESKTLDTDFNKGYFLHLYSDFVFYNKYFTSFSTDIRYDYDLSNKYLMEKYNVTIPNYLKNRIFFKEGKYKVFSLELFIKFIDEVSSYDMDKVKKEVLENNFKWQVKNK